MQPYGLTQRFDLHQLLPPRFDPHSMSESMRLDYESGLASFAEGDWDAARTRLGELPADGPSQVMLNFMARHGDEPPPDWDGALVFDEK